MNTPASSILLICMLAIIPIAAVAVFVGIALVRNRRATLRRDSGVPVGFGLDAAQGSPATPGTIESPHHHHHQHHHSAGDTGHHHSSTGFDTGTSHYSGGSDGGVSGGHH